MWESCSYSKSEINMAGRKLSEKGLSEEEKSDCLRVINSWRRAHAYPMNTFAIHLRHIVSSIDGAVVVQRLKRLSTIEDKLNRFPDMELYRMQDLGGCRVIVPRVDDVYNVVDCMDRSRIRHKKARPKNYIQIPKFETGYRGYHLIYQYHSERNTKFNGLRIEIQVRTALQHSWATAVETVGAMTSNGLKFNQGDQRWIQFFKLVSSLFALEEGTPLVEGTADEPRKLVEMIYQSAEKLNAFSFLKTIGIATKELGHINRGKISGYYLIINDPDKDGGPVVKIFPGIKKRLEDATYEYASIEAVEDTSKTDAVLVSAESYENLVYAYPNYFNDVTAFLSNLDRLLEKYGN